MVAHRKNHDIAKTYLDLIDVNERLGKVDTLKNVKQQHQMGGHLIN